MLHPLHAPRINNNDDRVRVSRIAVAKGGFVRAGEAVLEVESDKAAIEVEAEQDGYVVAILAGEGDSIAVGAVVLWLADSADAVPPEAARAAPPAGVPPAERLPPTAKARALLQRHGLTAAEVPHTAERLTAADVEAFVALSGRAAAPAPAALPDLPAPASLRPADPAERGMIATVAWQRDQAAATYLEITADPVPWDDYAARFATAHRLLFSPLLALLAHRLVGLAHATPAANATVLEQPGGPLRVAYRQVNLGFTVQAGETLYLVVLAAAERLDAAALAARLGELQRRAIARRLAPNELRGATVGFSSMARWGVSRHIPLLAPYTSLMVSHTVHGTGAARQMVLGASYDHRVLSGFDTARLLRALAAPPAMKEDGP